MDTAVVCRVQRAAGMDPGQLRIPCTVPAWLRAEYATKGAKRIARELGCSHERVYEALHAAGVEMRANGHYPKPPGQIPADVAERAVSLYVAGSSAKEVAAELGLKVEHVRRLVEERGVKRSRAEVTALASRGPVSAPPSEEPAELAAEVFDRVPEEGGQRPDASGTAREILPAAVVEQAIVLYLAGDSPRLIAP